MDRTGDSFTQDGEGYLLHVISSLAYLGSSSSVEPFLWASSID